MNNEIEKREIYNMVMFYEAYSSEAFRIKNRLLETSNNCAEAVCTIGCGISADGFCTNAAIPYTDNVF